MKKALITGITGQDGSYLAELLLEKGYEVHGIKRRASTFNTERIENIFENKHLHLAYGDLTDSSLVSIIRDIYPDEIYNLGAQSHVKVSFEIPEYTADTISLGTLRVLEAAKSIPGVRVYQASSSEMFGKSLPPQSENTPFQPASPYACAKVFAYDITRNYRDAYNIFASNGILFNHESPRRGETFVTRKITRGLARVKLGLESHITLGNLEAKRDWGHAKDYCEAMYLILQHNKPDDFVIATGESHSVREFLMKALQYLNIEVESRGEGVNEKFYDIKTGKMIVDISERYFRPSEVDYLQGDSSKAMKELKWKPKTTFNRLIEQMVESDLMKESKHVR